MLENTTLSSASQVYIRQATPADSPALSRICLLTGDAGDSAEHLHTFGELPGVMYAEPYVHLPSGTGFVLVNPNRQEGSEAEVEGEGEGEVVGYILTAFDTRSFEHELEESWFPKYRLRYPNPYPPSTSPSEPIPKPADERYITNIHNPTVASPAAVAFSPAHMHINILPAYQGQGWGRKLMGILVKWLKEEKALDGLWLGLDMRNTKAWRFYEYLGFKGVEGAPENVVGLSFQDWKG